MKDRIQVTPTSGTVLEGEPHEMARQFTDKVLHPLLMAMVERGGPHTVVKFYACLMVQLALTAHQTFGTIHAEHMLAVAQKAMAARDKVPGIGERAMGFDA